MSEKDSGGSAFPTGSVHKTRAAHDPGSDLRITAVVEPKQSGMTLRDYFAAKAMQGMCADPSTSGRKGSDIAEEAYQMADAMLAARNN